MYSIHRSYRTNVWLMTEVHAMSTEEKRKYLHEIIEKLDFVKIEKLYQLVRGIFGKTV